MHILPVKPSRAASMDSLSKPGEIAEVSMDGVDRFAAGGARTHKTERARKAESARWGVRRHRGS